MHKNQFLKNEEKNSLSHFFERIVFTLNISVFTKSSILNSTTFRSRKKMSKNILTT